MVSKTGNRLCIISFVCIFLFFVLEACAECKDWDGVEESTDRLLLYFVFGVELELMNIFSSIGISLVAKHERMNGLAHYDKVISNLIVWCIIACLHFSEKYGIMDWGSNEYINFRWLYSLLGESLIFGLKLLAAHISLECQTQKQRKIWRNIGIVLMLMFIPFTIGLTFVICNWNKVSYEEMT